MSEVSEKAGVTKIESSSEEEEEYSDGSEEGCDIEFPRDNANDLHQFLHRELNNLGNMEDP